MNESNASQLVIDAIGKAPLACSWISLFYIYSNLHLNIKFYKYMYIEGRQRSLSNFNSQGRPFMK
jgi:hypothetical protein